MHKIKYLIIVVFFAAGCITTAADKIETVFSNYNTIVFSDGINFDEAKIIAQKRLIKKNFVKIYQLDLPEPSEDVSDLPKYEDYWFISFSEIRPSNIPLTYTVIIDKQTGKVKFSGDHAEDQQWILEAALQR